MTWCQPHHSRKNQAKWRSQNVGTMQILEKKFTLPRKHTDSSLTLRRQERSHTANQWVVPFLPVTLRSDDIKNEMQSQHEWKEKIRHNHLGAAPAELYHDHHIVCSGGDEDNHHNKVACGINFCKMRERMFVLEVLEACRAQTCQCGRCRNDKSK